MHLVPCDRPVAVESTAPPCALGRASATARWDGFWGPDDAYYARLTRVDSGEERWFRIADDAEAHALVGAAEPEPRSGAPRLTIAMMSLGAQDGGAAAPLMLIGARRAGRAGRTVMWVRPARRR